MTAMNISLSHITSSHFCRVFSSEHKITEPLEVFFKKRNSSFPQTENNHTMNGQPNSNPQSVTISCPLHSINHTHPQLDQRFVLALPLLEASKEREESTSARSLSLIKIFIHSQRIKTTLQHMVIKIASTTRYISSEESIMTTERACLFKNANQSWCGRRGAVEEKEKEEKKIW